MSKATTTPDPTPRMSFLGLSMERFGSVRLPRNSFEEDLTCSSSNDEDRASPSSPYTTRRSISETWSPSRSVRKIISSPQIGKEESDNEEKPRLSSLMLSPSFSRKRATSMQFIEETDNMRILELKLRNAKCRQRFVQEGLQKKSSIPLKVRFFAAYFKWNEIIDKKEKTFKGKKIVEIFFTKTSKFYIQGLPTALEHDLIELRSNSITNVKTYLLSELANDPIVVSYLKERMDEDDDDDEYGNEDFLN